MWSEAAITEIKAHVDSGLSRGAIAQLYGVTRNSIIGLCHRQGIGRGVSPQMAALIANGARWEKPVGELIIARAVKQSKKKSRKKAKLPLLAFLPNEPEPLRTSLLDLTDAQCHWLCEGTDDHCLPTYCGHPSVDGRWCAHHYHRVYKVAP